MPSYGLGNYQYDLTVESGNAKFKFWDSEDSSNTAEVSVSQGDFPDGVTQADSRQVADLAYAKCEKSLNETRDKRLQKQHADADAKSIAEDKRAREATNSFLANASENSPKPDKVEKDKDGNVISNVYSADDKNSKGQ